MTLPASHPAALGKPAAALPLVHDPLAGLRAYHLPAVPSWWPPAPGWWVLAFLLVLLLGLTVWWLRRRHQSRAALRQALAELTRLRRHIATGEDEAADLRELSRLLRRYAIVAFPGKPVAALTGEQWLAFLAEHGGGEPFRDGPGRRLLEAPYRPVGAGQADELAGLVEDWIRCNHHIGRQGAGA